MNSKNYRGINIIRVLACIAILFYHIGLLKGGYLAVCTFFVLSGYLSVISAFNKEKFSLKDYYLNKLKKIVLPLLLIIFISIGVISILPNITWLNLKPETTSILLGYNNYWQLNANLDYFVRHIASPFMHLWYIAILIQFEIVFPFIFLLFKKIGEKITKVAPCAILLALSLTSYLFFYKTVNDGNVMIAYYDTFLRSFSLLFGMFIGFMHFYAKPFKWKNKTITNTIFLIYIIALGIIFLLVDAKSDWFKISMLITTIISLRLITYGIFEISRTDNFLDKIIASLAKVSYEIYLIQYPVIFVFQSMKMESFIRIPLIIIITIILSYIIHFIISIKKEDKFKVIKIIGLVLLILMSVFGIYKYVTAKDYAKDMKKLEKDLDKNRALIEEKQKQYKKKEKSEEEEWETVLSDLENSKERLKEMAKNIHVVGIGDSVMELAVKDLYKQFPNGYFDAVENRTEYQAVDIIKNLEEKNMLGDLVVLNLGTNGDCGVRNRERVAKALNGHKALWLNTTHADCSTFNDELDEVLKKYPNIHVIDWKSVIDEHPEYLISDKVHPTVYGCKIYAETIYNAIYQEYLVEFNKQKDEKIKKHEEEKKDKISFIGNDLLLGLYDYIEDDYDKAEFVIDKDFTYKSLKAKIESKIKKDDLPNDIVFMLDKSLKLTDKEYSDLIKLCGSRNVYIVDLYGTVKSLDKGVKVIDFSKELSKNKKYINIDGIHLTNAGNEALQKVIEKNLNK